MSKYTTELRFICETLSGLDESKGYDNVEQIIDAARPKIFDFSYPIFDSAYKPTLERKILMHFYTREIGQETYGLWKLRLRARLNEIMPYYNKLYESELIEFNPLYDTDIHTEGHRDDVVSGSSNSSTGGKDVDALKRSDDHWDLYSDTPQGGVKGIRDASDPSVLTNGYLTNARRILSDENDGATTTTTYGKTTSGSTTSNGDVDYTEHVYGYRGRNPSKSLLEFRNTFLNIDAMVLEELNDLFFMLW